MTTNLLALQGRTPFPGTSTTQSPWMDNPITGLAPPSKGIKAMNELISMVLLNNSQVKRLNAFWHMWRLDPREVASVTDDKKESLVPTLGTLMDILSALGHPLPADTLYLDVLPYPGAPNQASGLVEIIDDLMIHNLNPKFSLDVRGQRLE